MLTRPAIIQNELDRAESLAPYECKHGKGCFYEECAFKKRVQKTLDSMRKNRKENQGDFPPENGVEKTDRFQPDPEASAEARKEHFRDQVTPEELDTMMAAKKADPEPVSADVSVAASAPRDALLNNARQAGALAKEWRKSQIENDAELSAAATNAAESWREIASALTGWEFDDDDDGEDSFYEGAIDKLVARQMRYERKKMKSGEALKDFRREQQPGIEALAARLVKLDVNVARQVFNCLAIRGPCGRMEGVNFMLSGPFAGALQRALDDTQSDAPACAAS